MASILVSTRNRCDLLEGCLRSLVADASTTPREIIVIDNGSTDRTRDVVAAMQNQALDIVYAYQAAPGLSHARNHGVALARGRFLLFTDDDVFVESGWADAILTPFSDPAVGAVGGRIIPEWPYDPPAWMGGPHSERLTLRDYGFEPRLLDYPDFPAGANLATRTSLARDYDPPFDPQLGNTGNLLIGAEEYDFLRRVASRHRIAYEPRARVRHRIQPERMEWDAIRRSLFQLGFGCGRWERVKGAPSASLPRRLVRTWRTMRGAFRIKRANTKRTRVTPEQAWEEFAGFMWAGLHLELLCGNRNRIANWIARWPV